MSLPRVGRESRGDPTHPPRHRLCQQRLDRQQAVELQTALCAPKRPGSRYSFDMRVHTSSAGSEVSIMSFVRSSMSAIFRSVCCDATYRSQSRQLILLPPTLLPKLPNTPLGNTPPGHQLQRPIHIPIFQPRQSRSHTIGMLAFSQAQDRIERF